MDNLYPTDPTHRPHFSHLFTHLLLQGQRPAPEVRQLPLQPRMLSLLCRELGSQPPQRTLTVLPSLTPGGPHLRPLRP